jgi:hypothetical protein
MATIRELLTRANALDAQIKLEMHNVLHEFEPSVTPFLTISTKLTQERAINTKVQWLNKNPLPTELFFTGATESSAGTTGLTVNDANRVKIYDMLLVERTGELIYNHTAPGDATTLGTVGRDWGSATAGAGLLTTGDRLLLIGRSAEESVTDTTGRAILPVADYNYTQLWEDYAQTSEEAELMETYTGEDLRDQSVRDMKAFHKKKVELSCIFGERAETADATSGHYVRTMRGFLNAIQTNVWTLSDISEFTRLAFDDFMIQINEKTPDRKDRVFVCSQFLKARISGWAMNMLELNNQMTDTLGMEVNTYKGSTGGKVDIIEHPLLIGDYLSYLGFFLEYDKIAWKVLKPTTLLLNVQEAYQNYYLDKIKTRGTMRLVNENRMGMVKKAA